MADIKIKLIANYAEPINKHLRGFGVRDFELSATSDYGIITMPLGEDGDKLSVKDFRNLERKLLKIVRFKMVGQTYGGVVKIVGAELVH